MGIAWQCDKATGCIFETWEGTVSFEDWLRHVQSFITSEEWPGDKRHLVDLRNTRDFSDIFESDLGEVTSLISIFEERAAGIRLAIVSLPDARKPELFIQFLSTIGVEGKLFTDLDPACAWLELDPARSQKVLDQLRNSLRR